MDQKDDNQPKILVMNPSMMLRMRMPSSLNGPISEPNSSSGLVNEPCGLNAPIMPPRMRMPSSLNGPISEPSSSSGPQSAFRMDLMNSALRGEDGRSQLLGMPVSLQSQPDIPVMRMRVPSSHRSSSTPKPTSVIKDGECNMYSNVETGVDVCIACFRRMSDNARKAFGNLQPNTFENRGCAPQDVVCDICSRDGCNFPLFVSSPAELLKSDRDSCRSDANKLDLGGASSPL